VTISVEPVDAATLSRHPDRVGDKPGKYWDYRECGWVTCPSPADAVSVPEQPESAPTETAVEAALESDVRSR